MTRTRPPRSRTTKAPSTRNTAIHIRAGDAVKPILMKADSDKHFESRTMLIEWLLHCYDVGKMPRPPIRVTRATSPLRPKAVSAQQRASAWYMRPPVATVHGTKKLDMVLAMTPAERRAIGLQAFDGVIIDDRQQDGPSGPQEPAPGPSASPVKAVCDIVFESCDPGGKDDASGCYWPMARGESLPGLGDHVRLWRPAPHVTDVRQKLTVMQRRQAHWHFGDVVPDQGIPGVMLVAGLDEHGGFRLAPV